MSDTRTHRFKVRKGSKQIDGKFVYPDYIVLVMSRQDAFALAIDLMRQLQITNVKEFRAYLSGVLDVDNDQE